MPAYYHSLTPFRAAFQTGVPVLTYHKLGPRPRGARLKGLYVDASLFARQLAELRAAGFDTSSLGCFHETLIPPRLSIILTFDDGFGT